MIQVEHCQAHGLGHVGMTDFGGRWGVEGRFRSGNRYWSVV